jgi:Ca2+-binding RTX toxin-like protein
MASVTIPGPNNTTIIEHFAGGANLQLAQQISAALLLSSVSGTLNVTTASSTSPPAPPANPNGLNELVITAGGDYTIPAGSAGAPDWVVVLDSTEAVTVHGSPNTSIIGGIGPVTIIDPSATTLAEGAGDAVASITGAGDVLAGNSHNDTLFGSGDNESIAGGTGSNLITAVGNNATVSATGTSDTIMGGGTGSTYLLSSATGAQFMNVGGTGKVFAGAGATTVLGNFGGASGADQIFGGAGDLWLATGGSSDTIFAGSGASTIYGAFGGPIGDDVIFGGSGSLSVGTGASNDTIFGGQSANQSVFGGFDTVAANNGNSLIFGGANGMMIDAAGSSDTIHAGSGNDTVFVGNGTIAGANLIFGGSGSLLVDFVGGTGSATIVGGSGTSTVLGNAGSNMVFAGSQAGVTMIALGPRGPDNGETLNAGASSTNNFLQALSGSDSVIGGSGNDTIVGGVTDAGATTMTGGAGDNLFFFRLGDVNGTQVVTDLTTSAGNLVSLAGYDSLTGGGPGSAAQAAIAGATTAGGNTSITLADGTQITFDNTTVAQLQQHLFST